MIKYAWESAGDAWAERVAEADGESESQAMQRQRVGRVTGLMPRAGNFRNICAAASDVICIRPRPVARPRPSPCYATSVTLFPCTCFASPPL